MWIVWMIFRPSLMCLLTHLGGIRMQRGVYVGE